jgi:hypothetical protein
MRNNKPPLSPILAVDGVSTVASEIFADKIHATEMPKKII